MFRAVSFINAKTWKESRCPSVGKFWCSCSCLIAQSCPTLCALWTVAHKAPLSVGSAWQEYWSGLPFPPPGEFPDPGIKLVSPACSALQGDSLPLSCQGSP